MMRKKYCDSSIIYEKEDQNETFFLTFPQSLGVKFYIFQNINKSFTLTKYLNKIYHMSNFATEKNSFSTEKNVIFYLTENSLPFFQA